MTTKKKVLPTTSLEWVAFALNDAATALPVLFTMLTKIGAKEGAMVADEILGHVKAAQKECAHLVEAEKNKAPPEATGIYDSAWVIEGSWSATSSPEYWVGSSAWSSDPYKSLRFASKQSAQQAADMMLVGINHRIACHEFFRERQQ